MSEVPLYLAPGVVDGLELELEKRDTPLVQVQRHFFIDNLMVRIRFIIVMIRWTGLAPWCMVQGARRRVQGVG